AQATYRARPELASRSPRPAGEPRRGAIARGALPCARLGAARAARRRATRAAFSAARLSSFPRLGDRGSVEYTEDVRVATPAGPQIWPAQDELVFYRLRIPGERTKKAPSRSFKIFLNALLSRKRMLIEAVVSTIAISLVSLGVSLFTMQVYDRVIPQRGLSTLWVL